MEKDDILEMVDDIRAVYRKLRDIEEIFLRRKFVGGKYVKMADVEYEDTIEAGLDELVQVISREGTVSDYSGGYEGLYAVITGFIEVCEGRITKCERMYQDLLCGVGEEAEEWREYAKKKVWNGNMEVFVEEFHKAIQDVWEKLEAVKDRVERGVPAFRLECETEWNGVEL